MHMRVTVDWAGTFLLEGQEVDLRACAAMLDAVARTGSLRAAADELLLSYRAVWGRMETLERAFGRPLVAKT